MGGPTSCVLLQEYLKQLPDPHTMPRNAQQVRNQLADFGTKLTQAQLRKEGLSFFLLRLSTLGHVLDMLTKTQLTELKIFVISLKRTNSEFSNELKSNKLALTGTSVKDMSSNLASILQNPTCNELLVEHGKTYKPPVPDKSKSDLKTDVKRTNPEPPAGESKTKRTKPGPPAGKPDLKTDAKAKPNAKRTKPGPPVGEPNAKRPTPEPPVGEPNAKRTESTASSQLDVLASCLLPALIL